VSVCHAIAPRAVEPVAVSATPTLMRGPSTCPWRGTPSPRRASSR
jgi:hypothetical protein